MALSDLASSFSYGHAGALLGLILAYTIFVGVWRLWFSPIAHIPGPNLAALTWAYEFYYDIVLGGQYTFKIIDLHNKYGNIVRINPNEVHIGDPDFYPVLYAGPSRRREKWRFFTKQFGADESALATIDHDHHRLRRAAINPLFSTQSVRKLQPVIEERVNALLSRLLEDSRSSFEPLNLMYPFSAFTNDVINEYSFARSGQLIEDPTFGREVTDNLLTGTQYGKWIQHLEIILKMINAVPEFVSGNLVPGWSGFLKMKKDILDHISEIKATENTARWEFDVSHTTIFHQMLSSKFLPPQEKSVVRLAQEGQILVQGGTLTTSWVLTICVFHLLDRPDSLRRLRDELFEAMPGDDVSVSLAKIENLPYLRAVIKESLRLGFGTSSRLARVCPDEALTYTDPANGRRYDIPAGAAAVSMTTYKTVTDPALFPGPLAFRPERWIADAGVGGPDPQHLDRYLTVFGGGTRVCLGMALAQAELFLMIAKLFRVWGGDPAHPRPGDVGVIRLFDTTARDCEMASDYFIPIPHHGSKGVRAVFEPISAD